MARTEAERPADAAEHDALDEELTDDAPAGRAEGDPHGDLAGAMRGAREQQVGDVRAGDEQHEADGAHHREEHDSRGAADVALRERLHPHTDQVLVRHPDRRRQAAGRSRSFPPAPRCACCPSARRPKIFSGRLFRRRCASFGMNGSPDLGVVGEVHPVGHDADDRRRLAVQTKGPAEHARIAAVSILPDAIAENGDRVGANADRRRAPKSRPRSGCCLNTRKALAVTRVPRVCSGSACSSLILIVVVAECRQAGEARLCARQSSNSACETLERDPERFCHAEDVEAIRHPRTAIRAGMRH